ncbi:MAG: hypothetical protein Fur0022_44570 [Anaerolineales bacterium]
MGYVQLNPASHIPKTWFGGTHQGRNIAITTFGSTYRYYTDGRSHVGVRFTLRIALEVQTPEIPGLNVARSPKQGIPQTFEEAFDAQGGGHLSRAAREAMLAFIYKGYSTGLKKDLSARFTPGIRNLTYRSRAGCPEIPPEILPQTSMILIHDHPDAGLSPERFRTLLDELTAVAQAIESGVVPPLLENQPIPIESKAKYAPWLMIGFLVFGMPAIACICAFIYGFLDSYR